MKKEKKEIICKKCKRIFKPLVNRDCRGCLEIEAEIRFGKTIS